MTRFIAELNGNFGAYWKAEAEKELAEVKASLEDGRITIDDNGIARNCIGRVVMADTLERIALVTDMVNVEATALAREAEVEQSLREYQTVRRPYSPEEMAEMQAAFGSGETVVNVLTGEAIRL